eukprot:6451768-Pyramimonas_sp.AAC.1
MRGRLPRQKGRIGKIYIAGVTPAATFGSAVVGLSDWELSQARRVLLSYKPPFHRGCSLTAKLALHGDPVDRASVAPAVHWASIVWTAIASPPASHYTVKEVCVRCGAECLSIKMCVGR